jgi:hypothetical protein
MHKQVFLPCASLILSSNIIKIADSLNPDLLDQVTQIVEMTCQGFRQGVNVYLKQKEDVAVKKTQNSLGNQKRDRDTQSLLDMGFTEVQVNRALLDSSGDF